METLSKDTLVIITDYFDNFEKLTFCITSKYYNSIKKDLLYDIGIHKVPYLRSLGWKVVHFRMVLNQLVLLLKLKSTIF